MKKHKYARSRTAVSARFTVTAGLTAIAAFAQAMPLLAQTAPAVPGPASPSRLPEQFKPPAVPKSQLNKPSGQQNKPIVPGRADGLKFVVTEIMIDGATVYSPAQLAPLYSAMIGQKVSLEDLNRLKDAITAKYRADGYILSQTILPPQPLDRGIVHFRVVEGYISNVTVAGNYPDSRHLIAAMGNKLVQFRPLRARQLERYVLLVNDLPGAVATATLTAFKAEQGSAELILTVNSRPVSATLNADNRGSKAIGPVELSGSASFNSLFGLAEQISFQVATTGKPRQLQYGAVRHSEVLNSEGLRLSLEAAYGHSRPSGPIAALDARGVTESADVELAEPVIRSRSHSLTLAVGLTLQNNRIDLLGQRFSNDRIRYVTAHALYDFADEATGGAYPAQNLVRVEVHQGISILRASNPGDLYLSRAAGRGDATVLDLDVLRIQSLGHSVSVAVEGAGQYSSSALLPAQQFGLGGQRFGRGYEPSELLGDDGVAMSVEPRIDLRLGGLPSAQLYAFYEVGSVWQKGDGTTGSSRQTLSSAGGGVRFVLPGGLNAFVELANPLTRDVASRGNRKVRPLFGISKAF